MYKKLLFVLIFLIATKVANAQTIKIDNGILFSSFNNPKNLPIYYDNVLTYSVNAGVDFFEKKWFYLSSQVGYMRIGGKEDNPFLAEEFAHISERKNYIHANTTFRAYKGISGMKIFIGAGPYVNFITDSKRFESPIYHDFFRLKTYFGAKGELGVTQDFSKMRLGLTGGYMASLTRVGYSDAMNLSNNNWLISLSIGYNISK